LRILLLNQFYPPDVAPTGQVLHDLARTLIDRGHQVEVLCSRRSYDGGQSFPARETLDGVLVRRLPAFGFGRRSSAGKLADYLSYCAALMAHLGFCGARPDLILALTTPPYVGILGKCAAWARRCRHAHWIMDLYPEVMAAHGMVKHDGWSFRRLQALSRRQFAGAALVVALGPRMSNRLSSYLAPEFGARLQWVNLWGDSCVAPCPEGQANPVRDVRGWRDDELILLYSGNMGLPHRFQEFLAASVRLGANGPRWAFAGGGRRRGEIEEFARKNPSARIEILPYAPRSELRGSLCAADVHLASLDSAWQGLVVPSKVQSSFAAGKPVIFVGQEDNEIADWLKESGGGWRVPENDVERLLAAIDEARDPEIRNQRGKAALEYAQKHFNAATQCAAIAQMIENAASHPA
jgi:glycosyltransferase involved in cell wall biosynthesis